MDSKIADDERKNFSDRLKTALITSHQPTKPSDFAITAIEDHAGVVEQGAGQRRHIQVDAHERRSSDRQH